MIAAALSAVCLQVGAATHLTAADWPLWRCDAARSAVTAESLPEALYLQWTRHLPPQIPAWKDEPAAQFDRAYLPVVSGGLVFVASTVNDCLAAYDLHTGAERWRYYTEAPLRTAPAAWQDRLFVGSDDGWLYCLEAGSGRLLWRKRGGPSDRRLIGNQRLISTWPVRGGPVVHEEKVYFAAGVWPFMGTFIHALDARSGQTIWLNDSTSFTWRRLPHPGSAAFSGLSPQGHLMISAGRLVVPGCRGQPALFELKTGRFLGYAAGGGPQVFAAGTLGVSPDGLFELEHGYKVQLEKPGRFNAGAFAPQRWYTAAGILLPETVQLKPTLLRVADSNDPRGPSHLETVLVGTVQSAGKLRDRVWLVAGDKLVATGDSQVRLLRVVAGPAEAELLWQAPISGTPAEILAADGHLLVVTLEGCLYCFGPQEGQPQIYPLEKPLQLAASSWASTATEILRTSGATEGYCLVCGLKDGGLVGELLRQSRLFVIAVDRDAGKIDALRRRLDAAGLYGHRASALVATAETLELAPYLASLIVSEDAQAAGLSNQPEAVARLSAALRPYGGTALLALDTAAQDALVQRTSASDALAGATPPSAAPPGAAIASAVVGSTSSASPAPGIAAAGNVAPTNVAPGSVATGSAALGGTLAGFQVERHRGWTLLRRPGALPGAADWQGQNADAGNTRFSRDQLVRAPLGVLWFGSALSNSLILPRHGEGPVEQVVGGRIFIEGPDSLSAVDVYTGRCLWVREFPGLGRNYISEKHQPGAHSIGSNFYAVPDAVYVAAGPSCHVLDPASGRTQREIRTPSVPQWQFLLVYEDLLIAGADPVIDTSQPPTRIYSPTSSRRLVVFDRHSGRELWSHNAQYSFRHYGICAGAGKVFCIDRLAPETLAQADRRGQSPAQTPRILALDARSGQLLWQTTAHVAEQLAYSAEHDILVSAAALRGADGSLVWQFTRPEEQELLWAGKWGLMLGPRWIYTQLAAAFDLTTGQRRMAVGLDGQPQPWRYPRTYGCGPKAGAMHLLTFRSGAAGYCDLALDGGTGNLGGFRSGCTSNLIAAGGVLCAPDYTRTCTCSYQNRSSLGLIHMPQVEYWTFGALPFPGRMGFNFGAPGDRRCEQGTLWKAVPDLVDQFFGAKPLVEIEPTDVEPYYHHVSRMVEAPPLAWVAASGIQGARVVRVPLVGLEPQRPFALRLVFAEPGEARPGERVFSVAVDGKLLVRDLDIAREAGGTWRVLAKEFPGVTYSGRKTAGRPGLEIALLPSRGQTLLCGVELVQGADGPAGQQQ